MKPVLFFFFGLCVFFCFSCDKSAGDEQKPKDRGYGYFPLEKGSWWLYEADTIKYSPFGIDTVQFQIKVKIDSIAYDVQNHLIGWVITTMKSNGSNSWQDISTLSLYDLGDFSAQVVTDNQRFIKLVFPVKEGIVWNGNAYNGLGYQDYIYSNIGGPYKAGNIDFDSTVTVIQQNLNTLVSIDYEDEVYGSGIGLISGKKVHLRDIQSAIYKNGYIFQSKIVAWGKE